MIQHEGKPIRADNMTLMRLRPMRAMICLLMVMAFLVAGWTAFTSLVANAYNTETLRLAIGDEAVNESSLQGMAHPLIQREAVLRAQAYRALVTGDDAGAISKFERLLHMGSDDKFNHFHLGEAYFRRGDVPKAVVHWRLANAGRYFLNLGKLQSEKRNWQQAYSHLELALGVDPACAEAHFELGYVLQYGFGDCETAVQHYERSIDLNSEHPKAYQRLGQCYADFHQWPAAITAFQAGITRCPNCVSLYLDLSDAASQLGDWELAFEALQEAIRLNPGLTRAHVRLARVWVQKGDVLAAVRAYRQALQLDPGRAVTWLELAELLLRGGETEQALEAYERVIALEPNNTTAQDAVRRLGSSEP